MIRKKRLYKKPKKAYELQRILDENVIVQKYGLKNKREIWKALAKANYFRKRAMDLAKSSLEEQEVLFKKLRSIGLKVENTAEVLSLKPTDLLERRLSTIVYKKGLANTSKQARQLIVHKKILVDNRIINAPSYLVLINLESKISIKEKQKAPKLKNT